MNAYVSLVPETLEIVDRFRGTQSEVETQNRIQSRWVMFRGERIQRLSECDWVVSVSDSPLPQEKIDEWKVYRQALRDLPSVTEDPENPNWPTPPNV